MKRRIRDELSLPFFTIIKPYSFDCVKDSSQIVQLCILNIQNIFWVRVYCFNHSVRDICLFAVGALKEIGHDLFPDNIANLLMCE